MKLTKEIKAAKDKYGHPIDFTYCRKCNSFIHFEDSCSTHLLGTIS